jgi:hypothetical protein
MNTKMVSFHLPTAGQFSAAVDIEALRRRRHRTSRRTRRLLRSIARTDHKPSRARQPTSRHPPPCPDSTGARTDSNPDSNGDNRQHPAASANVTQFSIVRTELATCHA